MPDLRTPTGGGSAPAPRSAPPGDDHGPYDFFSKGRHTSLSFKDETYSSDALLSALTELLAPLLRAALAHEDKDDPTP
jgi:hypothetical protein